MGDGVRLFDPDRSRAVLIGVSGYATLDDLPAVRNNLTGLVELLTDPAWGRLPAGHCVVLDERVDATAVGDALATACAAAEDMFLIYFAGHGVPGLRRGDLFLALSGTVPDLPEFSALGDDAVRELVMNSLARVKVVILDCCFSGRSTAPYLAYTTTALVEQLRIEGAYVLTASPPNQVALSGQQYSEFTGELLTLLRHGVPDADQLLILDTIYPPCASA